MDDDDATAASRRNLSFVLPPVSVDVRARATTPPDDRVSLDSLPIRDQTPPPVRVAAKKRSLAVPVTASVFVILGGLAYWAEHTGFSSTSWKLADIGLAPQRETAETEVAIATPPQSGQPVSQPRVLRFSAFPDRIAAGESLGLCYEVANGTRVRIDPGVGEVGVRSSDCVQTRPMETTAYTLTAESEGGQRVRQTVLVNVGTADFTTATDRANILIFSPRPGSIVTGRATALCYAVSSALRVRVDPGIGEVNPESALTCLRVAPARTTTYQLSAYGRDGFAVRQQLVLVVR